MRGPSCLAYSSNGYAEHVTKSHGFLDYWHLYYRLREPYNHMYSHLAKREGKNKSWFSTSSKGSRAAPPSLTSSQASSSTVVAAAVADPSQATADLNISQSGKDSVVGEQDQSSLAKIYLKVHKGEPKQGGKKRKIMMTQKRVLDLDPSRKSDRAEVAILHADVVHNARNA